MAGGLSRRRFVVLAAAIMLAGCPVLVPTPGANVHGLNPEAVKKIEPSASTRGDVLMLFGDPDFRLESDRYFVYFWGETHAAIVVLVPYGPTPGVGLGETHALAIEFAADGRVARRREFTSNSGDEVKREENLWQDIHAWMKAPASAAR